MDPQKALSLLDSILNVHIDAVRGAEDVNAAVVALQNARLDLRGLLTQVIAECREAGNTAQ